MTGRCLKKMTLYNGCLLFEWLFLFAKKEVKENLVLNVSIGEKGEYLHNKNEERKDKNDSRRI